MELALDPPGSVGVTRLLVAREMRAKLLSPWFWLVASAVCLIAWIYGAGFQRTFETETVLVTTDPLMALDIAIVAFLATVLGLRLSTAVAWEREHGTLEVLLAGPVSWSAVLAAKFLAELGVLVLLVAVYWLYLVIAQPLGAGVIAPADTAGLVMLPVFALPSLALGLLVSAFARGVRGAVVAFLATVVLLAAFEIALAQLTGRPAEEMSLAALYVRATLEAVAPVVGGLSAVAPLAGLAEGLVTHTPVAVGDGLAAIGLTAAMIAAAVVLARFRGAQV
jgi:ABC-type transport system involved in multi-copper enzyme maturation permease subunit